MGPNSGSHANSTKKEVGSLNEEGQQEGGSKQGANNWAKDEKKSETRKDESSGKGIGRERPINTDNTPNTLKATAIKPKASEHGTKKEPLFDGA